MSAIGKAYGGGQIIHGHAVSGYLTPTYISWRSMKQRCYDPGSTQYHWYGERGITVCDEWRNDYGQFLADMGERPEGLTLDRINPDGNYEPSNCRWATAQEQARNRSQSAKTE